MNETPESALTDAAQEEAIIDEQEHKAPAKPKATKKPKPKKAKSSLALGNVEIGPKDYSKVTIPESEDDPHWDPKLKNAVPEGLVDSLADLGWDPSSRAIAIAEGDHYKIIHGKTRWRALERANKLRKNAGKEPLTVQILAIEEDPADLEAVVEGMERNVALNFGVQEIDPMTTAESIVRLLSAGLEEKVVAKRHSISVNDLHGYLLLTDEDKCPPNVQEMLRQGQISFTAALELARKAESMTKAELTQAAEQIAKVASGGLKVTAAQVKRAAGVEGDGPATQKQKKQFILDLQSGELRGKMGEACKWAAIVAMEVGLGTRTVDSAWSALGKLAQGQTIRVDFKQYVSDANVGGGLEASTHASKPVKGQDAPKAAKKSAKKGAKK